jgi:hypothetical protein
MNSGYKKCSVFNHITSLCDFESQWQYEYCFNRHVIVKLCYCILQKCILYSQVCVFF